MKSTAFKKKIITHQKEIELFFLQCLKVLFSRHSVASHENGNQFIIEFKEAVESIVISIAESGWKTKSLNSVRHKVKAIQ